MSALTFDTHAVIKDLTNAGLSPEHAEVFTGAIQTAQDTHLEQLAAKADL
tara:strand:+ start:545 stop:694 length:150 start_codon:yes stop_codon:yes gene_type:complete